MTAPWLDDLTGTAGQLRDVLTGEIPRIRTDRLVLRAPHLSDWRVLEPIWTSERARFIGGPMSREDAWLDFNQLVSSWLLRGIGGLTITLRTDRSVLGLVGVAQEFGDPEPELGWLLTAEAEGKGYAHEAARALLPLALRAVGPGRLVSYVHRDNAASIRLAERLGAVADARPHPLFADGIVYRHANPESPQ